VGLRCTYSEWGCRRIVVVYMEVFTLGFDVLVTCVAGEVVLNNGME
jgi:hypothetical protein